MIQNDEPLESKLLDDDGKPRGSREKDGPRIKTRSGWHQHWWVKYGGRKTRWVEIIPTANADHHWERPQGG